MQPPQRLDSPGRKKVSARPNTGLKTEQRPQQSHRAGRCQPSPNALEQPKIHPAALSRPGRTHAHHQLCGAAGSRTAKAAPQIGPRQCGQYTGQCGRQKGRADVHDNTARVGLRPGDDAIAAQRSVTLAARANPWCPALGMFNSTNSLRIRQQSLLHRIREPTPVKAVGTSHPSVKRTSLLRSPTILDASNGAETPVPCPRGEQPSPR